MPLRLPIQRKLFLSHFLAVLLVSGSVGTYFYVSAVRSLVDSLRARLQNSAGLVSQAIDAQSLASIQGPEDTGTEAYQSALALLRAFKHTNEDIAFLYIMRREGDRVLFVVDSDETPKQAQPGREYTEVVPGLKAGFFRASVDREITQDEWGSFMSGYSPLKNGQGRYLVGLDMRADEVSQKLKQIRISGAVSLLISLVLALLFSRYLSVHLNAPIKVLIRHCKALAEGRLNGRLELNRGDELDDLMQAFNSLSAGLAESRQETARAAQALHKANEELEDRVETRTQDLLETNKRLLHEIEERQKAEEALALAARTDALTGLLNRRAMVEHLEYEVKRSHRGPKLFALMMCDLDEFKKVNDTWGHDAGDNLLRLVSGSLSSGVRTQDLVSRWGGEEFLLMLPETDRQGALVVAEKVLASVREALPKAGLHGLKLGMSIGVTEYRPGQTLDACIKAADEAMYHAKSLGGDRALCMPEEAPPPPEAGPP